MSDLLFYEDAPVGLSFDTEGIVVTESHVVQFAGLSGDFFALHMDDEFARSLGFPGRGGAIGNRGGDGLLQQRRLRDFCLSRGVHVESYATLGAEDTRPCREFANLVALPEVAVAARSHACTPAQVLLAWALSSGMSVVPKSSSAAHIAENFAATSVRLSGEELAAVAPLDCQQRRTAGATFFLCGRTEQEYWGEY